MFSIVPTTEPIIEGYQTDQVKQPRDTVILKCSVVGGNPLPSLQWYRNDKPYHHEFRTDEQTSKVWSELIINVTRSDNDAKYRCDASNAALTEPYSKEVTFKVKCEFCYSAASVAWLAAGDIIDWILMWVIQSTVYY